MTYMLSAFLHRYLLYLFIGYVFFVKKWNTYWLSEHMWKPKVRDIHCMDAHRMKVKKREKSFKLVLYAFSFIKITQLLWAMMSAAKAECPSRQDQRMCQQHSEKKELRGSFPNWSQCYTQKTPAVLRLSFPSPFPFPPHHFHSAD